jgi:hypothetical protein
VCVPAIWDEGLILCPCDTRRRVRIQGVWGFFPYFFLEVLLGVALFFYPCGHNKMLKNSPELDDVAAALRADLAANRAITIQDLLSAPVPALCQHPAGRLRKGSLPGLGPTDGYLEIDTHAGATAPVLADLTGDGIRDAAAVIGCSAGGVSWPDSVVFYGPGTKLLGVADLSAVHPAEHANVTTLALSGGDVRVAWSTTEGCCFQATSWTARLHWNGTRFVIADAKQVGGVSRTKNTIDVSDVPDGVSFATPSGHVSCDLYPRGTTWPDGRVRCDIHTRTFTPPPKPAGCEYDWGPAIDLLDEAGFVCANDSIVGRSLLDSGRAESWWDISTDGVAQTPAGEAAALPYGTTMIADDIRCTSAQAGLTCRNTRTGAQFFLSQGRATITN